MTVFDCFLRQYYFFTPPRGWEVKSPSGRKMELLIASDSSSVERFCSELSLFYGCSAGGGRIWPLSLLLGALGKGELWGLKQNGQILALSVLRDDLMTIHIDYLATHPNHQKKGYMSNFFMGLTQRAQVEAKEIWLEVAESNRGARSVYRQFFFREVGKRLNYYKNGENALLYSFAPQ